MNEESAKSLKEKTFELEQALTEHKLTYDMVNSYKAESDKFTDVQNASQKFKIRFNRLPSDVLSSMCMALSLSKEFKTRNENFKYVYNPFVYAFDTLIWLLKVLHSEFLIGQSKDANTERLLDTYLQTKELQFYYFWINFVSYDFGGLVAHEQLKTEMRELLNGEAEHYFSLKNKEMTIYKIKHEDDALTEEDIMKQDKSNELIHGPDGEEDSSLSSAATVLK